MDKQTQQHKTQVIITIIVLAIGLLWYAVSTYNSSTQNREIKKQTKELDALHAEAGGRIFTQEEIDIQLSDLDELHEANKVIGDPDKQMKELDILQNNQQTN